MFTRINKKILDSEYIILLNNYIKQNIKIIVNGKNIGT